MAFGSYHTDLLHDLQFKLAELTGRDPGEFRQTTIQGRPGLRFRCLAYEHEDREPSAWLFVGQGGIVSGCFGCESLQVWGPIEEPIVAPTLLTLARGDQRLIDALLKLGVEEGTLGRVPCVAFPVAYGDGREGHHYRVRLNGPNKWRHQEGGKASEAVFGLHSEPVGGLMRHSMVVICESPLDASVLFAIGCPAISVLGKANTRALGLEYHKRTLLESLDGGKICVWQEPDGPQFAQDVANALGEEVLVIKPSGDIPKDAYRIWLSVGKDWGKFEEVVKKLLAEAEEVRPERSIQIIGQGSRGPEEGRPEVKWVPLRELQGVGVGGRDWVVEGVLRRGDLALLAGRPKLRKSILLLNLLGAIALGRPFLGRSCREGRALLLAPERGELSIERAFEMGLDQTDRLMIWAPEQLGACPTIADLDLLERFVREHGVMAVGIDTLGRFLAPRLAGKRGLNDYDLIYPLLSELSSLGRRVNAAFVCVHHTAKMQGRELGEAHILGSTGLSAACDVYLLVDRGDGGEGLKLVVGGNLFEEKVVGFEVGEGLWVEEVPLEPRTKQERAAQIVLEYLGVKGSASWGELVDAILEADLVEGRVRKVAENLLGRALRRLQGEVVKGPDRRYHQPSSYRGKINDGCLPSQPSPPSKVCDDGNDGNDGNVPPQPSLPSRVLRHDGLMVGLPLFGLLPEEPLPVAPEVLSPEEATPEKRIVSLEGAFVVKVVAKASLVLKQRLEGGRTRWIG